MQTEDWKTAARKLKNLTLVIVDVSAFCKFFVMDNPIRICELDNMNTFVRNNGNFSFNWH